MPRIQRWTPVDDDLNEQAVLWKIREEISEKCFALWYEIQAIGRRCDYHILGDNKAITSMLAARLKCKTKTVLSMLNALSSAQYIDFNDGIRVLKHPKLKDTGGKIKSQTGGEEKRIEENRREEIKDKNHKNDSFGVITPFPADWQWLRDFIESQKAMIPVEEFLNWSWWDAVSYACGGLDQPFLETEFARMRRWLMENPKRHPTPRGWPRFLGAWLERAHDKERRFPNAQKARRS